jgi:hypothetical protein
VPIANFAEDHRERFVNFNRAKSVTVA